MCLWKTRERGVQRHKKAAYKLKHRSGVDLFFFSASFKHWKGKGEKAKDSLNLVLIEM